MIFYNLFLFFYFLVLLPQVLLQRLKGKRYPQMLQRLGFVQPLTTSKKVIWVHAVSVGEVKAAQPILSRLKTEQDVYIFVTTTTKTGHEEAKRSLPQADALYFLPLDFSFCVRLFIRRLRPSLLFLMEGDFWPNLLKGMKASGGKVILLNGKISERSMHRWSFAPRLAKKIFDPIDLFCVQSDDYAASFRKLIQNPSKVHSTGNLKLDAEPQAAPHFDFAAALPLITISCTHYPEELHILRALRQEPLKILLAPRHPERFEEVARLLEQEKIPYARLSEDISKAEVVLIDAMGKLPLCYRQSRLAIVGGSFVPHVGGHNIFEPCLYNCPVLFGPYMSTQKELVKKVLSFHAGVQAPLEGLLQGVRTVLSQHAVFAKNATLLAKQSRGAAENSWKLIRPYLTSEKKLGRNSEA